MIREQQPLCDPQLDTLIQQDNARNYFIRLGFLGSRPAFSHIFTQEAPDGSLCAALFQRHSGNLQFCAQGEFDTEGFASLIQSLDFNECIAPASLGDQLMAAGAFSQLREGALIAGLYARDHASFSSTSPDSLRAKAGETIKILTAEDLPEVIGLYLKVFHSFSPLALMESKLALHRGRGVLIRKNNQIIAVAQSEFETPSSAIIVGVATHPDYQGQGWATQCMEALCRDLRSEGKDLFLQYDNPSAGRLYEKLGFETIDRIRHYTQPRL